MSVQVLPLPRNTPQNRFTGTELALAPENACGRVVSSGGGAGVGVGLSSRVGIGLTSSHRCGADDTTKLSKLVRPADPAGRISPVYPPRVIEASALMIAHVGARLQVPSDLRYCPVSVRNTCARSSFPLTTSDTCTHWAVNHAFDFTSPRPVC